MKELNEKKTFDLRTHIRDGKGNIVVAQPYRLYITNGIEEFERPPGSGWVYTKGGDLIRKPKDQEKPPVAKKELNQEDLLAQIAELKAQNEALMQKDPEPEDAPDVDEEIPDIVAKPTFNKPSFLGKS
mgnify:FL=1